MDEAKRGAMLRREFERMLQKAGASKRNRVDVATILPVDVIARLLPWWRLVRVEWRR